MAWDPSTETRAARGATASPLPTAATASTSLPALPGPSPGGAAPAAAPAPERPGGARHPRFRWPNGASAAGSHNGRDPFLDNAKFVLVVLVVLGHNWTPLADAMLGVKAAYLLVYAIHMPALVLLCGYFSRGFTGRPDQIRRLLAGVLLPYLVFEAAYAGVYTLCWDQPYALTPTEPRHVCWFLAALFVWRLTAPLWRAVRWPVVFAAALSVLAGLMDLGNELALSRVLMLWPWFVLGLRLRSDHLRPLRNPAARRWALPVMVAGAAGAWWVAPQVTRGWLLMDLGSAQIGVPPLFYVGVRVALFGVSAVLVAAFLALVPSRRTGFTALGACTLYPFLLHGLVLKSVEGLGGYKAVLPGGLLAAAATTLLAGALAVLLAAAPVRRVLWPVIQPRFPSWLAPEKERAAVAPTGQGRNGG
ncbi:acyltransferase family protein [Streptomyces iconiensis]|uniref:Fucose 4-O-acetylase n=1 Tax=Streptomyces iconiensis TaxID=1384038 RepID=A0ABT7A8F4_9ACTN|nr:hypothetical protein [Streptomyces iconiensis]MDJ1137609.1 hypothetical protein [Streptomyces iconiensis]